MINAVLCPARGDPANNQIFSAYRHRAPDTFDTVIIDGDATVLQLTQQDRPSFHS
jgi:hypothetical protein